MQGFDALFESLDVRGLRESHLHSMLQKIELSFKETLRRSLICTSTGGLTVTDVKKEVSDMAPNPDSSASTDSPTSSVCVSNSDVTESSLSFAIGLGRNETEKKDALKRYIDLEKWMWEECLNSSVLCAIKYGKKRCKQLLGICNYCHDMDVFENNYCPSCHMAFETSTSDLKFSEAQCGKKYKGDGWTLRRLDSSPTSRIRLLKVLLALIEASFCNIQLYIWVVSFKFICCSFIFVHGICIL